MRACAGRHTDYRCDASCGATTANNQRRIRRAGRQAWFRQYGAEPDAENNRSASTEGPRTAAERTQYAGTACFFHRAAARQRCGPYRRARYRPSASLRDAAFVTLPATGSNTALGGRRPKKNRMAADGPADQRKERVVIRDAAEFATPIGHNRRFAPLQTHQAPARWR